MNRSSWSRVCAPLSVMSLSLVLAFALVGCGDRSVFGPDDDAPDGARDGGDGGDGGNDGGMRDGGGLDGGITDTGGALPDVPPMDAGRDAGDGGLLDVSLDVRTADVPLADAPLIDVPIDARLDAGLDVGLADAGLDAGLADAGLADAGLADAGLDAAPDGGLRRGPAPVVLGPITDLSRAGAYALIGKTGISNVTGTLVSGGHLGVSPEFSPAITGFGLVLDASGQFSTSPSVMTPWRVYAADYSVPTPVNLTSAILDMQGAYSDAATRVLPDFLNLLTGHLGGATLAPGLYTWMSTVDVSAGLTFDGGANDVWILQISGDVDLSAAVRMTLAGGARASNIFWQVAGQVTAHPGAHFEGIILCQTAITLQTGASLHGRALAQSLIALDDNEITAP